MNGLQVDTRTSAEHFEEGRQFALKDHAELAAYFLPGAQCKLDYAVERRVAFCHTMVRDNADARLVSNFEGRLLGYAQAQA